MRLTILPFEVIEVKKGVILKRGCIEIRIREERAAQALQTVLDTLVERGSATKEEICSLFASADRQAVAYLIDGLFKRRILAQVDGGGDAAEIKNPETKLDVFYWHLVGDMM